MYVPVGIAAARRPMALTEVVTKPVAATKKPTRKRKFYRGGKWVTEVVQPGGKKPKTRVVRENVDFKYYDAETGEEISKEELDARERERKGLPPLPPSDMAPPPPAAAPAGSRSLLIYGGIAAALLAVIIIRRRGK